MPVKRVISSKCQTPGSSNLWANLQFVMFLDNFVGVQCWCTYTPFIHKHPLHVDVKKFCGECILEFIHTQKYVFNWKFVFVYLIRPNTDVCASRVH